jgi:FkbM family methyltransferase
MIAKFLWNLWHYAYAFEYRFFLLYEFQLLKKAGIRLPDKIRKMILSRPGTSEDWIQISRFLNTAEEATLIDVGAYVGDFSAEFLEIYKNGRTICFEPIRENYEKLARRYKDDDRVQVHHCALSNFNGQGTMFVGRSGTLSSMEKYSQDGDIAYNISSYNEVETVSCRTLDSFDIDTGNTRGRGESGV